MNHSPRRTGRRTVAAGACANLARRGGAVLILLLVLAAGGCGVTEESRRLLADAAAVADGDLREWPELAAEHEAELERRLAFNREDRDARLLLASRGWRRQHRRLARALHVLDWTINERPLGDEWRDPPAAAADVAETRR